MQDETILQQMKDSLKEVSRHYFNETVVEVFQTYICFNLYQSVKMELVKCDTDDNNDIVAEFILSTPKLNVVIDAIEELLTPNVKLEISTNGNGTFLLKVFIDVIAFGRNTDEEFVQTVSDAVKTYTSFKTLIPFLYKRGIYVYKFLREENGTYYLIVTWAARNGGCRSPYVYREVGFTVVLDK